MHSIFRDMIYSLILGSKVLTIGVHILDYIILYTDQTSNINKIAGFILYTIIF